MTDSPNNNDPSEITLQQDDLIQLWRQILLAQLRNRGKRRLCWETDILKLTNWQMNHHGPFLDTSWETNT